METITSQEPQTSLESSSTRQEPEIVLVTEKALLAIEKLHIAFQKEANKNDDGSLHLEEDLTSLWLRSLTRMNLDPYQVDDSEFLKPGKRNYFPLIDFSNCLLKWYRVIFI